MHAMADRRARDVIGMFLMACCKWYATEYVRIGAAASRLALPPAVLILLPIGGLVAAFLHGAPLLARNARARSSSPSNRMATRW